MGHGPKHFHLCEHYTQITQKKKKKKKKKKKFQELKFQVGVFHPVK